MKIFNKLLILLSILTLNNLNASTYSCLEDSYQFNQCKFDIPKIENGETKVVKVTSGLFEGRLVASCKNGKRVIISESCDFAYGEEDACKGIKPNTWTGRGKSTCSHKYQATAVNNGDTYKVYSTSGNGYVEYKCDKAELSIKSMDCEPPTYSGIIKSQSVGSTCTQLSYQAQTVYDYADKKYIPVPPNDNFCINEGYDKMDSFSLVTSDSTIQSTGNATYNVSCCRTQELGTLSAEVTVTPIDGNCANVSGILGGDYNDITGRNTTQPSGDKVLNNFCKPNSYNELSTFSVQTVKSGSYTYDDEFQVDAMCCGLVNAAENNQDCKGQFISSGAAAEAEAKSYGIPYLCDSSSGVMECYQNTCTEFVAEADLCAECDLGDNYSFNANSNTCQTPVALIYSGHESVTKLDNNTHSGYAVISCMNGDELVEDARCFQKCPDKQLTWESPSGGVCYYDLSGGPFRHYLTPTDNDLTNPHLEQGYKTDGLISAAHTGVAYFHCEDGNWVENSEHISDPVCFASCSDSIVYWGTGISKDGRDKTNACQSPISGTRHFRQPRDFFSTDPMSNVTVDAATSVSTTTNTGTNAFVCNDGAWQMEGNNVCKLDCLRQTVTWQVNGTTASATINGGAHGTQRNNVIATGSNYGQSNLNRNWTSLANFVCDDGKYILNDSNPTVYEQCNAGSVLRDSQNYENSCTYSWPTIQHGDTITVSAGGNGTGSATLTCIDGNIQVDNLDCNRKCDADSIVWNRTSGASGSCPSGFTLNGGMCEKTNSVDPACPTSGFTFNASTGVCQKSVAAESSNDADIVCQGDYDDYEVTGTWNCYKKYVEVPVCPNGYTFNGTKCEANSTQTVTSTWECPAVSQNPQTPSGASAGNWVYQANFNDVNVLDIQPNCPSGYSFDSSTGKCKTTSTVSGTWSAVDSLVDIHGGGICNTTFTEWKYVRNKRTTVLSGTCSNLGETVTYNYCLPNCEPVPCRDRQNCPRYGCEYVSQTCNSTQSIYANPSCPSGYILQSSGYCRKEESRTNACVRDISVTPSCPSGFTWNGSQCQGSSQSNPTLSCDYIFEDSMLVADRQIMYNRTRIRCGSAEINNQCCITSDLGCPLEGKYGEPARICDWIAFEPTMTCNQGSLSGEKCITATYKTGTCPSGFALSGSKCVTKEVIDANEVCPDGSTAPCTSTPLVDAKCSIITLPDGTKVTPTVNGNFCTYEHTKNGVAEATCPAGQTVLGDQCIESSSSIETEFAVCSNNGLISGGKCVKTESFEAPSSEPVTCSVNTSLGIHGTYRSLRDSTTNGATGSTNIRCDDGNWLISNDLCYKDCSSTIQPSSISTGTMKWDLNSSVGAGHDAYGMQCSHNNITKSNYGHSAKENNVATLDTEKLLGTIDYTCNDGWWVPSGGSCDRVPCTSTSGGSTVSWTGLSTCKTSSPSNLKWGDITTLAHPFGYSGDTGGQYKCIDSGAFSLQNTPDCNKDCNAGSDTNGFSFGSCYAQMSDYMTHDTSSSYYDLSGNTRGRTVVSCNNGRLSNTNELCNPVALSGTSISWGNCGGSLSGSLMYSGSGSPYFLNGGCETVNNTKSGYSGSASVCATSNNSSGYAVTSRTCNKDCARERISWSSGGNTCSAWTTSASQNQSVSLSDNSGTTGTATATCNNGSWNVSNKTCKPETCRAFTPTFGDCTYAPIPETNAGSGHVVSVTTPGYTGSIDYHCYAGEGWERFSTSCDKIPEPKNDCTSPAGKNNDTYTDRQTIKCGRGKYWGDRVTFNICLNGKWEREVISECGEIIK